MVVLTFDCYSSLTLYMHDYDACTRDPGVVFPETMGFDSINPPIKIKLLPGGNLDMVNIEGSFISDVKLTTKQKEYIANVDETKCIELKPNYEDGQPKLMHPSKENDYEIEEYWPLTSRMRGYTVTFKHCSDTESVNDHWVRLIRTADRICKKYDRFDDSDDEEPKKVECWPTDDESEESEDNERQLEDVSERRDDVISLNESDENMSSTEYLQKPKVLVITMDNEEKVAHSDTLISTENMFKEAIPITMAADFVVCNMIAIENTYQHCNKCTVKEIDENTIIEMFNTRVPDGQKMSTVCVLTLIINQAGHSNAHDVKKHEKAGYAESGVNFYKNASGTTTGVIFNGNQDNPSFNYAIAMESELVIPDLLLSDEAIANMHNFSPPLTNDERHYWYKYEDFKKAILNY